LEAFPDLHAEILDLHGTAMIEKSRTVANLDHAGLTHRFFHDQVQDLSDRELVLLRWVRHVLRED